MYRDSEKFNEHKPITQDDIDIILKGLSTVSPLEDRAFQILLDDYTIFSQIVKMITGIEVDASALYHFQTKLVFTVDGKEVILDNAATDELNVYNIEGQNVEKEFPFERHLYYWAFTFASQLKKGIKKYNELKPVVSIVIYKEKKNQKVIESAGLTGGLLLGPYIRKNKSLLQLFAVNAAKWEEEKEDDLKAFLAIVSLGVCTDGNRHLFKGIDTSSDFFIDMNRAIRFSCTKYKSETPEVKGDANMKRIFDEYLTKEEQEIFMKKGEERGIRKGEEMGIRKGKISILLELGKTPKEISDMLKLPVDEIITFKKDENLTI